MLALLVLCVASRLVTTVYYIEDPDSLRFALSLRDYDVTRLQPHFPGYPVFSFLGKPLYLATGSFAASFSVLGGVAVFGIAYYLLRILKLEATSLRGGLVVALVFFNPLVWLMSNRYMPDLLGVAFTLASFHHLVVDEGRHARAKGFLAAGLLAGVRLSYLPFVLPPVLVALARERGWGRRWRAVGWGTAGVLVWLVPLVAVTGPAELVEAALGQARGHFTEFGGTVVTEPDWGSRALGMVEAVWADGLGGYWGGRHALTLAVSAGVAAALPVGLRASRAAVSTTTGRLMVAGWGTYLLWIALYQNVIYKSRHVLPLLPFVLAALALGGAQLARRGGRTTRVLLAGAALAHVGVTGVLVVQHRSPTAIAQVAEHLRETGDETEGERYIYSIPLVNDYLRGVGVSGAFLSAEDPADRDAVLELGERSGPGRLVTVGAPRPLPGREPLNRTTFYHNPYVNRMWPEVEVHDYDLAR